MKVIQASIAGTNVRRDQFGRVYFEKCATDEEHFTRSPTPEEGERTRCRVYLDNLLDKLVGLKVGQIDIDIIVFDEE